MSAVQSFQKCAVIGAGFAGLGVMSAFLRDGVAFDAFEAEEDLGGNWRHGVYDGVHIISSRKTTEFPDYPMPSETPDFPSAAQMIAYLRSYADRFQLRTRITFNKGVKQLLPEANGHWRLVFADGEERIYTSVVISTGHHWDRIMPEIKGEFTGELIHSKDYKHRDFLKGKRVLVIGGGNSACDIAVEAARTGEASSISLRHGYWFLPKTMFGIPTVEIAKPWMPVWFQRTLLRGALSVIVGNYEQYGLPKPNHKIFEHHPTINAEILHFLKHGRITPRPEIDRVEGKCVYFANNTKAEFDLIVAATGFKLSVPVLGPEVLSSKRGIPQLIGGVVSRTHPNLYVFGFSQPRYGAGPLIHAGATLVSAMVRTQPRLKTPIGELLSRLGVRPPSTVLQDPFAVLRQAKYGARLVEALPKLESWILRTRPSYRSRSESSQGKPSAVSGGAQKASTVDPSNSATSIVLAQTKNASARELKEVSANA